MSRQSQLQEFNERQAEWKEFGIDEEQHRTFCELCHVNFWDNSRKCTVGNCLKMAMASIVDTYFDHIKPGIDKIDDKPTVHRKRLEGVVETAKRLRERISELPEKTEDRLFETVGQSERGTEWIPDFISCSFSLNEISSSHRGLGWLGQTIRGCEAAIDELESDFSDGGKPRDGERALTWEANDVFHLYLAYGLSEMSEVHREELIQKWPEGRREKRDEFIASTLQIAGAKVGNGDKSKRAIRRYLSERDAKRAEVGEPPDFFSLCDDEDWRKAYSVVTNREEYPMVKHANTWHLPPETDLDVEAVGTARELMLQKMERMAELVTSHEPVPLTEVLLFVDCSAITGFERRFSNFVHS